MTDIFPTPLFLSPPFLKSCKPSLPLSEPMIVYNTLGSSILEQTPL